MKKFLVLFVVASLALTLTGCTKKKIIKLESNQTAVVVPAQGETGEQQQFQSAEYLRDNQVAAKRIEVKYKWRKTGALFGGGFYPETFVYIVDRAPITREWTNSSSTGTSIRAQAIEAESKDSVSFSLGIAATGMVPEKVTYLFLYTYSSKSLEQVMDTEVRTRIQARVTEFCAGHDMDALRDRKIELIEYVRADVIPFFEGRGLYLTTVGLQGGIEYANPNIQTSIDSVMQTQQLEEVERAKVSAQEQTNKRLKLAAEIEATKVSIAAQAEAGRIRTITQALIEAQKNPLYYQIENLKVERARVDAWDGVYPQWYMGGGSDSESPGLLITPPISR